MYGLYGNGVNDDYSAIQEMLDSGINEVVLPAPEKYYLISKTLKTQAVKPYVKNFVPTTKNGRISANV